MPLVQGLNTRPTDVRCLAFANYDPAGAVTKTAGSLIAMTALDTTNLRLTFNAPASGKVYVRLVATLTSGGATFPSVLLGIKEGAAVVFRASPTGGALGEFAATRYESQEVLGVVAVSAGSHTFDAAYGVEVAVGTTAIKYGGPDNTTTQDAWGAFQFEIWAERPSLTWQPAPSSNYLR